MNDPSTLSARPLQLTVGAESFDLHPFTVDDWAGMQAWVDTQFPDPFDVVCRQIERGRLVVALDGSESRAEYPLAQQQFLLKAALEQSVRGRRLVGTPEADDRVRSMEGILEMLKASIRKGRPDFSDDDARRLYKSMTIGHVARVFQATSAELVLSDPKAPTPSGGTTTPA